MLILIIHKIICIVSDPLLLLAIAEQLFWEGDSHLIFKSATVLLFVNLILTFTTKMRFSISFIHMLIASALLFFEVAVAIDVSQYQRMAGIREGVAIGSSEILSILVLFLLTANAVRNRSASLSVKWVSIAFCFASFSSVLSLIIFRSLQYGLTVNLDYSEQYLLSGAIILFLIRIISRGNLTCLPTRFSNQISKSFAYLTILLSVGFLAIVVYCFRISNYPLPIQQDSGYKVSKSLLVRLILVEDPLFLSHFGVDFKRIRDVVRETIESGSYERGGSTIPMQLAKIQYLYMDKTLFRKLQQFIIGLILELRYSKDEIMEAYLERVTYASDVRGLRDAARKFYDKDPTTLEPEQALTLVMSIYDPSNYNPRTNESSSSTEVKTALINNRIRRYNKTLVEDLKILKIAN